MRKIVIICCLAVVFITACTSDKYQFPQADIHLSNLDQVEVHRYGKALFELDTAELKPGLKSIQNEFSIFLDADLDDQPNIDQLHTYVTDTQLISIYHKVMDVYPDLSGFEMQLSEAFERNQHFYPLQSTPEFYSYISDLYFERSVMKTRSELVIAIDVYLGADYPMYLKLGLPLYKIRCMTPENKIVDVMKAIYFEDVTSAIKSRTLLDRMIEGGKLLAYLDAVLPATHDSLKICYSGNKLKWAETNERNVWAFMIENDLLYSTDYQIQTKMIQDGPFTTGFSDSSPSRLGIFIGWQIVRSYLKNNPDVKLQEALAEDDSQKILNGSGYSP